MTPVLLALGLGAAFAVHRDPLVNEIAKAAQSGYQVRERLATRSEPRLEAVIFRDESGPYDRLKVYEIKGGNASLIYLELASAKRIEFDPIHRNGKTPDLYGDRTKTIAYHTISPGPGIQRELHLLKYGKGNIRPDPNPLPEAKIVDIDGDGGYEIISKSLPLGGLFEVECQSFRSMAQTAFRASIYQFHKGQLVYASSSFPSFFDKHLASLEGDIAVNDPHVTQRYGEFLGAALGIYFDYAEKGSPQQGWARFSDLFKPRSDDPYQVQSCIRQMKQDIRRRLRIPDHWPD